MLNRIALILILVVSCQVYGQKDEFLTRVYDRLHDSPIQQKFRKISPIPVGCVYIQKPGEGEEEMRWHFRTMKQLGFTALKQIMNCPDWTREQISLIALDEGIIPWWYGQGGWQEIDDQLLQKMGIPADTPIKEIRTHPKMIEYQTNILRQRIQKATDWQKQGKNTRFKTAVPNLGGIGPELTEEGEQQYIDWVKEHYRTIKELNFSYNQHHFGLAPNENQPFSSWPDFENRWQQLSSKEYRHLRDIFRLKADNRLDLIRKRIQLHREFDPVAPFRAGGEMGMFLPFAYRGVDMEGIAELMTEHGSFYPSVHLAWHFDAVDYEIARPHYMQCALTHDYFKGGWSATWESTGGPQYFSGGKGGNTFTVDDGIITQLMLNCLAAGYKGFGLWCWSARTAGWEAGEYSLLDRHNKITPHAVKAGKIGQTARKYRDELWQAHKEPLVGIYVDWDNEAIWAAMSVRGRDHFRQDPINARVGVSRALINANIPFEYVTATDLRKGLAGRYRIIYMPFIISIADDMMPILQEYVKNGGRLVMDMPSAFYDQYGALMYTDEGSDFEKIFGVIINQYQGAGVNKPYRIDELNLEGMVVDMTVTDAVVQKYYNTGLPAITESAFGKGTAVILGYEASMMCFEPGHAIAESLLLKYTMGNYTSPYRCDGAIVYRLSAPTVDHYFFINDGPEKYVSLETEFKYRYLMDAITGKSIKENAPVKINAYNGRWLRCKK